MDKLFRARRLLSRQILKDFVGKITGEGEERIVGTNPENRLLVGKLMSVDDEANNAANTSKTFIASIGIDFYVDASEIDKAIISVTPKGDFYYRVLPTIEEQRAAMHREVIESITDHQFATFDEVLKKWRESPKLFGQISTKLVPVYKKITIGRGASFDLKIGEILDESKQYAIIDAHHSVNVRLDEYLQDLQANLQSAEDAMKYDLKEPVKVEHLLDGDAYKKFIESFSSTRVIRQNQNWNIYFDIRVKRVKNKYLVSVHLVNNSKVLYSSSHKSRKDDKATIETLFNSGIEVVLNGASFCPIELESFADDYKYDKKQYALGNNCSVEYDENKNRLFTNHLPLYEQYRLITNDELSVGFEDLVNSPIEVLANIKKKMREELKKWKKYRDDSLSTLTEKGKEKLREEIRGFEDEVATFENGIRVIENYSVVRKSFIDMNKTFARSSEKYSSWRLFQIVFIVSVIPDIAACDQGLLPNDEKDKTNLSSMSLLYFPTGGGKTEAFLGVLIFNLFFDRYRGKMAGVTGILRYPLRLLSVQQVQRLANVLASAEMIRRITNEIKGGDEFSLGYFVGDNNTPNRLDEKDYERYLDLTQNEMDEYRVIDICPFCRKKSVHLKANKDKARLIHYCDNKDCDSGGDLPLYVVDEEIYRFLPSAIISTVDKLAIMGCNANFRNIVNGAKCKCPVHGYTSKSSCIERTCKIEVNDYLNVSMYDPAPTLLIQDELHLIRESLGTYASHYESFLRYFIKNHSESGRDVKVIGATATISSYKEQVYHLYGREPVRFPCESPYIDKNFYAHIDKTDLQRLILGYAPYGRAIVNSVVFSLKYMREVVFSYYANPQKIIDITDAEINEAEALEILKDYWIFLEYNNVKRDGNNVDGAIKTPVNEELATEGIIPFKTRAMTGDESFQDVREILADIENDNEVYNGTNLITATSMISHGVDADRFNVMFFYGIPGNVAEYIQAYSRTGRKHSSIVIDLIRPTRETDQSYLKNFVNVHKYKDLLIEPVPINKWASKAIKNTLPGVFMSLILCCYDNELQYLNGSLFQMKNLKECMKIGRIKKDTIIQQLLVSYGCVSDDGIMNDIGNQYNEYISQFVEDIFAQILDKTWANENVFSGFNMMGYQIMNSLRDTDSTLLIELD